MSSANGELAGLMGIGGLHHRYEPRKNDAGLREQLLELVKEKPRYGYRRCMFCCEEPDHR